MEWFANSSSFDAYRRHMLNPPLYKTVGENNEETSDFYLLTASQAS